MTRSTLHAAVAALALLTAAPVLAQGMSPQGMPQGSMPGMSMSAEAPPPPAPPRMTRVMGTVQSISDSQVVLTKADGTTAAIALLPSWSVMVAKPVPIDQIQPGSYLGTTNYAKPDGTGASLEVHVFPPGMKGPGADFVMDPAAGTTMTNGMVGTVAQSDGGRVLSVNYGAGVRTITVPPGVPVTMNTPGDRSLVAKGASVTVINLARPGGEAQFISIDAR